MVLNTVRWGCTPYFIRYRPLIGNQHLAVLNSTPSQEEMSVRQQIQGVAVVKRCKTGLLDEAFGTTVWLGYLVSYGVQLVLGCIDQCYVSHNTTL